MSDPKTSTDSGEIACRPEALAQVLKWLLEGNTEADIREALAIEHPGDDPQQLLAAAMDHFATIADADHVVIRGWCLEAYREMYRRMVSSGDYAGALRAVKALHQIAN